MSLAVLTAAPASATEDAALAFHWAPIHHQDTDSSDHDADYLSTVDFDGEWNTSNNWENQDDDPSRLTGAAYYSVVETSTHWFITYSFYHPRDWVDFPDPFGQFTHENDMEGLLATVRKDGTAFGRLEAVITVAHKHFYSYVPEGGTFTGGRENVDGTLLVRDQRPTTRQEAKGHGLYAWNGAEFPGGDGVVYVPSTTGEAPSSGNDRSVGYRLVDTFAPGGLWARRDDSATFAGRGTLRGDNGKDNAAHTAWGWDDTDDGDDLPRGLAATDPAYLVSVYFGNRGAFSLDYTRNAFR
ncbi:hypothetical protein [Saccharothrix obliqua]|uniref:hypothetical protein n=1 Tax=Saccharothrix obliqua TaxID=2861747 RepID=UPI0027E295C4|nr:hypothetical protein [Saccharothrix obliqua]